MVEWQERLFDVNGLRDLRARLRRSLQRAGARPSHIADSELVLTELLTNSLKHGATRVEILLEWRVYSPVIIVIDDGPAFELIVPAVSHSVEGGRGLYLVSSLTKAFAVKRTDQGNVTTAVLGEIR